MEWLILVALIVVGVGSNAEATVPAPLEPTLAEIQKVVEISPKNQQKVQLQSSTEAAANLQKGGVQTRSLHVSLKPQKQQKEILDKISISYQWPITRLESHKKVVRDPEFVLLGPVFEEFVEAARQIKPSHLVLALRYIRNSQMSTEEIIEMIMNWPPKRLEHLLSEQMQQEFDLLVKALQKLPRDYLLKGICFIRSSKETSGQLASLLTN